MELSRKSSTSLLMSIEWEGVKKYTVKAWLDYLIKQSLYKHYNRVIDWSVFKQPMRNFIEPGLSD